MSPRTALASFGIACFQLLGYGSAASNGNILVIGATGSTGFRALQGLLDTGYKPNQIKLLTRNDQSEKSIGLRRMGFELIEADLEDLTMLQEKQIAKGCVGCYVHSTSSDIPELDTGEVSRAQNLALIFGNAECKIRNVVYNSAAAHENHRVKRIQQKHDVEVAFQRAVFDRNSLSTEKGIPTKLSFTSLRANIFMEELWKKYTRPQILNGVYPLPVRSKRKVYLMSVRDMGRLAGRIFQSKDNNHETQTINVAGDYLSAKDIASAFAVAQGTPCRHRNPRMMTLKSYFKFPELYEQIHFLQTFSVETDIDQLREQFPDTMTTFAQFLKETDWGDHNRTYANFRRVNFEF